MTISLRCCLYLGIVFIIIFNAAQVQNAKRYKGHKVLRAVPRSNNDVAFLEELLKTRPDVDVWKAPSRARSEVHIHLGPDLIEDFKALLQEISLTESITMADSQEMIDNQISCCKSDNGAGDFDSCYHTLEEIHSELHRLEETHPAMAKLLNLGNSHEGRRMLGIKIKRRRSDVKGLIFLNFGIHAREWISPATGMYLIRQLLNPPSYDEEIKNMLDKFEWVFLPVSNVDGFIFTHEKDRLWRKNRREINSSFPSHCVGVDLNRNFESVQWGKGRGANHPCSNVFPGERPFSEIESLNIAAYLSKHKHKMVAVFDIHSYSKLWMSPWGWKDEKPPEYSQMETLMKAGTDAIYDTTEKRYTYGPIFSAIYPTYGDLTDYVYDKLNVTHAYGLELRPGDNESNGFLLPACEIVPTGREIMAALKAITPILAKEVEEDEKQNKKRRYAKRKEARDEVQRKESKRDARLDE